MAKPFTLRDLDEIERQINDECPHYTLQLVQELKAAELAQRHVVTLDADTLTDVLAFLDEHADVVDTDSTEDEPQAVRPNDFMRLHTVLSGAVRQ